MGKRKSNIFTDVFMPKVETNHFDLSHDLKLSFQMGRLVPTLVLDTIPGDKITIRPEAMLRFAPLISPVMHRVNVTQHFFFCPNRLLWSEWEDFIMRNEDFTPPQLMLYYASGINTDPVQGSIADYMGIPAGLYDTVQNYAVSAFPIAAYCKIYDEYYRDQNLQDAMFTPLLGSTSNDAAYHDIFCGKPFKRAWQHDYFTSCLPFAQKGDPVQIPLTFDSPEVYLDQNGLPMKVNLASGGGASGPVNLQSGSTSNLVAGAAAVIDPNGNLKVDIQSNATDINTLRRAFRLQEWLEKNARAGTRYIESILAHFGVRTSDARLQRPEYIGGTKARMVISEVLATAQNDDATVPVGQMAGHGISVSGGNSFTYTCEEHGYIIGIINVQPETAYQDGMHRHWTRYTALDYAWPTFAHIGEQEVLTTEVQARIDGGVPNDVFGYIPRYSEYKFMNSRVASEMRNQLDYWHLGRKFDDPANPPKLNSEFIECNPSTRIFAVTDPEEDHIFAHLFFNIGAVRKLPKFGVPTI